MDKITIVLVESHDLTRIGLINALKDFAQIKVIGEASEIQEGFNLIQEKNPDIVIIDLALFSTEEIEFIRQLKQSHSSEEKPLKLIVLMIESDEDSVLQAFALGADSYCLKNVSIDNLQQAIQVTHEGDSWIEPAIASIILEQAKKSYQKKTEDLNTKDIEKIEIEPLSPESQEIIDNSSLTDREMEVLELIVAGKNNAEIAEDLYISIGTVKTHVRSILAKLCVCDRTQAAVHALRSGLVN